MLRSHGLIKYQIKIVPAFVKKPNALQEPAPKPYNTRRKEIPLLDVSPEHVVAEAGPFRVILNKYCAVRNQVLLSSVSPRLQTEVLDSSELSSVYRILNVLPPNHLAFYNCGADSGASQPHKHMQIVPLEPSVYRDLFPISIISESGRSHAGLRGWIIVDVFTALVSSDTKNRPIVMQHPGVPYTHFIVQPTGECTGEHLQLLFNTLLSATKSALASQLENPPLAPVYNFLMARDWLMMIPRTNASCNGVGVNSLGMLGILWLGNNEQLQTWSATGFDEILAHVGLHSGGGIMI